MSFCILCVNLQKIFGKSVIFVLIDGEKFEKSGFIPFVHSFGLISCIKKIKIIIFSPVNSFFCSNFAFVF